MRTGGLSRAQPCREDEGLLVEPDLDHAALATVLQRGYGLTATVVRFIPAGETSWCYQVTDQHGGRWFLKLSRPGAIEGARADFSLQLGDALAGLGLPVPRPRSTQSGELWCWLDGLRVAVFEFVDAQPLSDQDLHLPEVVRQTARLVAAVHAATPALAVPVPFVERFEVWAEGPHRCLAELQPDATAAGLRREARALGWPQRGALLAIQERLGALGAAARSRPTEWVLCHGDLIGDNLLADRGGRLWAVDWDGAVLAPRERDLALLAGQGFEYRLLAPAAIPLEIANRPGCRVRFGQRLDAYEPVAQTLDAWVVPSSVTLPRRRRATLARHPATLGGAVPVRCVHQGPWR